MQIVKNTTILFDPLYICNALITVKEKDLYHSWKIE